MSKASYSELLRDPRWQKIRLKVLERDKWRCLECGNDKKTLNVHHCYYLWGRNPWEYEESSLLTLCEPCHENETALADIVSKQAFHNILAKKGFMASKMLDLLDAFSNLNIDPFNEAQMLSLIKAIRTIE